MPGDRLARARVYQWLFFEQNQVEPGVAVARFMALTGRVEEAPGGLRRPARARAPLTEDARPRGLADGRPFVASDDYTVADIALLRVRALRGRGGRSSSSR